MLLSVGGLGMVITVTPIKTNGHIYSHIVDNSLAREICDVYFVSHCVSFMLLSLRSNQAQKA